MTIKERASVNSLLTLILYEWEQERMIEIKGFLYHALLVGDLQ